MEHQGYDVQDVLVHQDNESAILLETNGRKSAGKSSRHIKIKYFLVAGSIKAKEMRVLHCPIEDMIADFYTKPLQGALFIKHRNSMLGIDPKHISKYMKAHTEYIASLSG